MQCLKCAKCTSAFQNRCVFGVFRKSSALSAWSRTSSCSTFQAMGPAMENAWRPSMLRRCRGTTRWWRLENRSRWQLATSNVRWQQFTRYWGHRWTVTPSLWRICCRTLSQCSSSGADVSSLGGTSQYYWRHGLWHSANIVTCQWWFLVTWPTWYCNRQYATWWRHARESSQTQRQVIVIFFGSDAVSKSTMK